MEISLDSINVCSYAPVSDLLQLLSVMIRSCPIMSIYRSSALLLNKFRWYVRSGRGGMEKCGLVAGEEKRWR